ncbi:MAG: hypothetical protein U9Q24_00795 [Candidatus Ratteibacteria bacterium]|nr:hypothetical protein [Candidatus Ratteibacteria bacterium]
MNAKAKLNLAFCLIFFIQGCIPLAYPFKEAIPSKIRAQGEAEACFQLEDPRQVRRLAAEAAYSEAMFNLMRKIEDLYITPLSRVGTILERNPQAKLEVLSLVNQARIRKTRFLKERKIMVELELNGDKLREVLSPYR